MGKFENTLTTNSSLPLLSKDERNLILNCARLDLDDSRLKQTKEILNKKLNWESIIFYSKYHSVAPLIYRNFNLHNLIESIPRDAKRSLIKLYQRTEYQNRIVSNILSTLLAEFNIKDIPVMVLKGIALVEK